MKKNKIIKFIFIVVVGLVILFLGFYFKDNLSFIPQKESLLEAEQLVDIQAMTSDSVDILYHSWSPDGKQIVFETYNKNNDIWAIWVMDVEKKELKRLTGLEGQDSQPMWNPDGKQIIFVSSRTGSGDIWIMNNDGSNQKQLTKNIDGSKWNPAWSPDGKKISFVLIRTDNVEIWTMNSDGGNQKELINNLNGNHEPMWSPDGKKISFQVVPLEEFWIVNSDGNKEIPLTKIQGVIVSKVFWLPDGNRILYKNESNLFPYNSIWTVDSNGSNRRRLTADNEDILDFSLSSDGKNIAYIIGEDIWTMDSNGNNKKVLFINKKNDFISRSLSWSPDSRIISFIRDNKIWTIKIK